MSKNFYLSIFFGFFFNVILGQNPIEWISNTEKINDSTYNLTTTAKIENNWRQERKGGDGKGSAHFRLTTFQVQPWYTTGCSKTRETGKARLTKNTSPRSPH